MFGSNFTPFSILFEQKNYTDNSLDTNLGHPSNGMKLNQKPVGKSTVHSGIDGINNGIAHAHVDSHVHVDAGVDINAGELRDNLAQTFGRSRGSLMHRSGTWTGEGLMDEPIVPVPAVLQVEVEVKPSLLSAFMTRTKVKEKEKEKEHSMHVITHTSTHVSPKKTVSDVSHNRHPHGHTNVSQSPSKSSHDRWSARIMSASLPTPIVSTTSERNGINSHSNSINNSNGVSDSNGNGNSVKIMQNGLKNGHIPLHESAELSDAEIAALIRDRLRKKLKTVLRPKVPPSPLGPHPSSASP